VTTLSEVAGGTQVSYTVDAAITGKLGSIGQPVLRSKAKEMESQFVQNLHALLEQKAKGVVS
jgi:carbon monoxide dehydrogenase subunit G